MSDFNLPSISIKPVSRVFPSRYNAFKLCRLREILAASGHPVLLPVQPTARIGSVVHRIIELANAGKIKNEMQFNESWRKEVSKNEESMTKNLLERHLVPLEETADDYEVKKLMALHMISGFFPGRQKQVFQPGRSQQEKWLETKDSTVGGKIDLIQETSEGSVIIDYKTGSIIDDKTGEPKEDYQLQLKLYAALYFEKYNKWPNKLLLVGIDQSVHEVTFTDAGCKRLLGQAKKLIGDTNKLILSGLSPQDFATPSPKACRYCLFRPGCKQYWQTREDTEDWPIDLIGSIKEKGFSGNKLGRIVIDRGGKEFTVRALSDRHSFLYGNNKNVLICNLGNDTSSNNYIERMMTTGYGF
ncbi:MAG: PD-(D/E)XK nuclease family protein [Candidatus Lokiarchaeia archaeon]